MSVSSKSYALTELQREHQDTFDLDVAIPWVPCNGEVPAELHSNGGGQRSSITKIRASEALKHNLQAYERLCPGHPEKTHVKSLESMIARPAIEGEGD